MAVLPAHRSLEDFVELFERKGSWNPQLSPHKWFAVSRGDSEVNACGHRRVTGFEVQDRSFHLVNSTRGDRECRAG